MTSEHLVTAKEGITLMEAKRILAKAKWRSFRSWMMTSTLKGSSPSKDIEKQIKYPSSAKGRTGTLLCGAAVGITANVLDRVKRTGEGSCRCGCPGFRSRTF